MENIKLNTTNKPFDDKLEHVLLSGANYNDKYVAFWGSCFSNFFPCHFSLDGKEWSSSEKYFMWKKAVTFGDNEIAEKILKSDEPRIVKKLGRQVKGFTPEVWDEVKVSIMHAGVSAKFSQDEDCNKCIKMFPTQTFIEGSPVDVIWGVGLHYQDENIFDESKWRGQNLLGKILNNIRDEIFQK